jgi:hypothetical protein
MFSIRSVWKMRVLPSVETSCSWVLLHRADFRREHARVLGSRVTALSESNDVRESGLPKLAQEGNSFLRTCNSRKPIRFIGSGLRW